MSGCLQGCVNCPLKNRPCAPEKNFLNSDHVSWLMRLHEWALDRIKRVVKKHVDQPLPIRAAVEDPLLIGWSRFTFLLDSRIFGVSRVSYFRLLMWHQRTSRTLRHNAEYERDNFPRQRWSTRVQRQSVGLETWHNHKFKSEHRTHQRYRSPVQKGNDSAMNFLKRLFVSNMPCYLN